MTAPDRSATSATIRSLHPLRARDGNSAGPASATSTRADRGAVRTRIVNVPPSPLAEWATALDASSETARTRLPARGQPVSDSAVNRRAAGPRCRAA
jgi:hypothetical protein